MTTHTYKRNWFRHMRLHYQFVMGNEKRALYDFFMFVCGPAVRQLSERLRARSICLARMGPCSQTRSRRG